MMRVREWLAPAAARGLGELLAHLPLPLARDLGRAVARAHLAAGGRRVHWTLQNLRIAFPSWSEAERRRLALQSAENLVFNFIDLFRSERWSEDDLLARFEVEGIEHLGAAMRSGRGAVMLSLHMGCYDVGLRALSVRAPWLRFAAIAQPLRSAIAQGWLCERRNGHAVEIIAPDAAGALRAFRMLRVGRPVIVLGDLYVRYGRRAQVPFFGRHCLTAVGPAVFARGAPAALVPCYVVRDAPDHHVVRILPEIELPPDLEPGDEQGVTRVCNAVLEEIIRKHPDQWIWGHRRFRHSPDLPPGIYRRRRVSARFARARRSS